MVGFEPTTVRLRNRSHLNELIIIFRVVALLLRSSVLQRRIIIQAYFVRRARGIIQPTAEATETTVPALANRKLKPPSTLSYRTTIPPVARSYVVPLAKAIINVPVAKAIPQFKDGFAAGIIFPPEVRFPVKPGLSNGLFCASKFIIVDAKFGSSARTAAAH